MAFARVAILVLVQWTLWQPAISSTVGMEATGVTGEAPPQMSGKYMYVFETMLLLIVILISSTCWLVFSQKVPKHVEAGVQANLDPAESCVWPRQHPQQREAEYPTRESNRGAVYLGPHSTRWHRDPACGHLRSKARELTPCSFCASVSTCGMR
ncbi:unnamed protein product [Durusdinium trenchii]|uniref:Uncharacterized protein n=1 Tax=Durusdinium trenchii TaxID=1381693 RepID=A0ABP0PKF7_9DINO